MSVSTPLPLVATSTSLLVSTNPSVLSSCTYVLMSALTFLPLIRREIGCTLRSFLGNVEAKMEAAQKAREAKVELKVDAKSWAKAEPKTEAKGPIDTECPEFGSRSLSLTHTSLSYTHT